MPFSFLVPILIFTSTNLQIFEYLFDWCCNNLKPKCKQDGERQCGFSSSGMRKTGRFTCSLPHSRHLSQPTQSMMREMLRKCFLKSSYSIIKKLVVHSRDRINAAQHQKSTKKQISNLAAPKNYQLPQSVQWPCYCCVYSFPVKMY